MIRGDRELSLDLVAQAKALNADITRAHAKAAEHLFREKNSRLQMIEIDLHGLHVKEALSKLELQING